MVQNSENFFRDTVKDFVFHVRKIQNIGMIETPSDHIIHNGGMTYYVESKECKLTKNKKEEYIGSFNLDRMTQRHYMTFLSYGQNIKCYWFIRFKEKYSRQHHYFIIENIKFRKFLIKWKKKSMNFQDFKNNFQYNPTLKDIFGVKYEHN